MTGEGSGKEGSGARFRYEGGLIKLDREGRWFHDGVEITHGRTLDLFNRSIERDPEGGYRLSVGLEYAPIDVEDTPYFVRRVDLTEEGAALRLSDGTDEALDPATLRVGGANVLYCAVKGGEFPAKFLRPAYYQLMERLEETGDGYGVRLGGELWLIKENAPS